MEGMGWRIAQERVSRHPETHEALASIMKRPLDPGGFAFDAVRAAIHFMDAQDELKEASAFAGVSNYCPLIVGALIGAWSANRD